ncbi:hypothetical protein RJ641_025752 [Dillenia turbinata]|uniref:TORTIFOLIA1/SINE1-2 N-terminal domain-containing protein n=1 Tax=Dillenia turbinata TaxID=194707 RepID=A0AAN8W3I2_9MAGN
MPMRCTIKSKAFNRASTTEECIVKSEVLIFILSILTIDDKNRDESPITILRIDCKNKEESPITIADKHKEVMVGSIIKRFKDLDSVVRDACVETSGVLASKLRMFGSTLCLARVIENTPDPLVPILERMLTRTIKLLKNPRFMVKLAVIELNKSILMETIV